MSEKRFFTSILTEGIFLLFLGILMLTVPKLTSVSFGFMMCLAFISYGGYKIINSFMLRNFSKHYIIAILSGLVLSICGFLLYIAPLVNIMWIILLSGIYFILESITTAASGVMTKSIVWWWQGFLLLALIQLIFGICVLVIFSSTALWFIGIVAGIDFVITGITMVNVYLGTNYIR